MEYSIISNYLYRTYNSKIIKNEIIKQGYVPHISYKRKRGFQKKENTYQQKYYSIKNKQWVVENGQTLDGITDSKLFIRCEKKFENYFELVHLSCTVSLSIER